MASAINPSLDALSSAYVTQETEEEDPLGRDAFLTMLVAQLENQDPLNPMDGTDFTAQLAQFSNLEQQFTINDNLEEVINVLESKNESNLIGYIGKEVSAEVDTIEVRNGIGTGSGFFELSEKTNVLAAIYDEEGALITSMNVGSLNPGEHSITWNGKNSEGETVDDGTYYYEVFALNDSGGYSYSIPTTVSGEVDGVVYRDGVGYLTVDGAVVDPSRVVEVSKIEDAVEATDTEASEAAENASASEDEEDA